jgi:hypothetical protein
MEFISQSEFWVAVSFFIFMGVLVYLGVHRKVTSALDARGIDGAVGFDLLAGCEALCAHIVELAGRGEGGCCEAKHKCTGKRRYDVGPDHNHLTGSFWGSARCGQHRNASHYPSVPEIYDRWRVFGEANDRRTQHIRLDVR